MTKPGQTGFPKARHRVAFFVSPHGFGHAARAAAVMAEMQVLDPSLGIEIFTTVPRWLFEKSLEGPFGYHEKLTDIGMAQRDALHEDIPATAERLARFLPFAPDRIREPAACLQALGCRLAICDISPLGLAAAGEAGIPSVLVENFTWDWIYAAYANQSAELQLYAEMLKEIFQSADYHIQARPACSPGSPNLSVPPVCRSPRLARKTVRKQLGLAADARLVAVSMGGLMNPAAMTALAGVPAEYAGQALPPGIFCVVPGGDRQGRTAGNWILLPHNSGFFHPDLIAAADAVVGKVGYSTLAEVYRAGIPFGYVARTSFPESPALVGFIEQEMAGLRIPEEELQDGRWLGRLPELLEVPRRAPREANGAVAAAEFLVGLL